MPTKRNDAGRRVSPSPRTPAGDHGSRAGPGVIGFTATLLRPKTTGRPVKWTFLILPASASSQLPSRGQTTVNGLLRGVPFQATLEPDGRGGHWLKVNHALSTRAKVAPGDTVSLELAPVEKEPEPKIPVDLREAIAAASPNVRANWSRITPIARRDFIQWITSARRPETRTRRVAAACDMLAKGKRRPCCFDRSGVYGKNLRSPVALED